MATSSIVLSTAWQLLVDPSKDFLISMTTGGVIEVAMRDTATPPIGSGHLLRLVDNDAVGRGIVGPGYVYARAYPPDSSANIALTLW